MHRLLVATRNRHKTTEIAAMAGSRFTVEDLTLYPDLPEVDETGATFLDNATLKALAASRHAPGWEWVLADDSGLEVDALQGAPGVRSARYSGENATDRANLERLLAQMGNSPDRAARFRCVIVVAREGERLAYFEGACEGRIIETARGVQGFGYDPVFVPEGETRTFAELPSEMKNRISHRAKALNLALAWLDSQSARP